MWEVCEMSTHVCVTFQFPNRHLHSVSTLLDIYYLRQDGYVFGAVH